MKKILYVVILFLMLIPSVKADDNLVNIYLFHSENCHHCENEIELLNELEKEYSNIRVYKYEVSDKKNSLLFGRVTNLLDARTGGVPFTVIGGKHYNGFNVEKSKKIFLATIEYYSKYGYKDVVGEYIGNIELPSYEVKEDVISLSDFVEDYGNYKFHFLFGTNINTKNLDLSTLIVLISLLDVFSGISFFALLIVIFLSFDIKEKKKMFLYGSLCVFVLSIIYLILSFCFQGTYLKLFNNSIIKIIIASIIIVYGGYKLIKEFFNNNDNILDKKIIIKYMILFIGLIVLILFSLLNKSLYFFSILKDILYLNNLSNIAEYIYIIMYFIMYIFGSLFFYFISVFLLNGLCNYKIFHYVRYFVSIIIGILIIVC